MNELYLNFDAFGSIKRYSVTMNEIVLFVCGLFDHFRVSSCVYIDRFSACNVEILLVRSVLGSRPHCYRKSVDRYNLFQLG